MFLDVIIIVVIMVAVAVGVNGRNIEFFLRYDSIGWNLITASADLWNIPSEPQSILILW
jgi:hypothetical protein